MGTIGILLRILTVVVTKVRVADLKEELGMAERQEKLEGIKEFAKNVVKGATANSIFDPDMKEEKAQETPEFTTKQLIDHITGEEKLTDEQVEQLRRATKYSQFL
jgi:hypothetical protein